MGKIKKKVIKHPMQPVMVEEDGVHRFKRNKIVEFLLENGGYDMNQLARMHFTQEDEEQFAQLIGYSVSGFGELPYASKNMVRRADRASANLATKKRKR